MRDFSEFRRHWRPLTASFLGMASGLSLNAFILSVFAPYLIAAHRAVRPGIDRVLIWNRDRAKAAKLAQQLEAEAAQDLEAAVRTADVVSCATASTAPLVKGAWLKTGAHLDLVGSFTPEMREADDEAVRRARVFVDTREGALAEAGDLVQPMRSGILREADVAGDLAELARGLVPGRRGPEEITLFKSVGSAIEDLAAARYAYERWATTPGV